MLFQVVVGFLVIYLKHESNKFEREFISGEFVSGGRVHEGSRNAVMLTEENWTRRTDSEKVWNS